MTRRSPDTTTPRDRPRRRPSFAAGLLAALLAAALASVAPAPAVAQDAVSVIDTEEAVGPLSSLTVETGGGVHRFEVELVDTPATRSRGLMERRSLPDDRGMLFDMERTGEASFWMKDTYVSLDIIFIAEDGRVVRIARRTTPLSERPIMSGAPVRFVLELVAGTAERIGLSSGDRIRHERIDRVAGAAAGTGDAVAP